jgi:hypothetical protein
MVQSIVQRCVSTCTLQQIDWRTSMCQRTITVAGARGGSGTTTTAAALALFAARHATTELVACEATATAALLGLAVRPGATAPTPVCEGLTLVSSPTNTAAITVYDAGRVDLLDDRAQHELLIAVLRGPCYLGLHTLVTADIPQAAGIVLLAEPERSLTRRDVADVCGVPVIAEIAATARVARAIDAGLLVTALRRLSEFSALRRYVDRSLAPDDDATVTRSDASRAAHPSLQNSALKIATDLPVALKRNRLNGSGRVARLISSAPFPGSELACEGRDAGYREVEPGCDRVLHR